ncbi:MAG: hypothetical protein M1838_006068, partial [Thelocarpon superellum]
WSGHLSDQRVRCPGDQRGHHLYYRRDHSLDHEWDHEWDHLLDHQRDGHLDYQRGHNVWHFFVIVFQLHYLHQRKYNIFNAVLNHISFYPAITIQVVPSNTFASSTSNITTDNLILDTSLIAGYNTYVLAFWTTYAPVMDPGTTGGPMDSIAAWTSLSDADRTAAKQKFHDADIRLTFTCFGGLDQRPAWTAADATAMGTEIAEFVQKYQFDGVDIDFEDFGYAQNSQPEAIVFLTTIFQTIRQALPRPYILSASVSPSWMVPGRLFSNMPGSVAAAVIDDLDYINGMYYYGGVGTWDTCPELTVASGNYQGCSTGEVMAQGIIPASKWLVGMPQFNTDGGNAFSDGVGTALGDCLKTVPTEYGGVGTWQYHPQYPAWIGNVRAAAGW